MGILLVDAAEQFLRTVWFILQFLFLISPHINPQVNYYLWSNKKVGDTL